MRHGHSSVFALVAIGSLSGCYGVVVEPGHRALLFNPRAGGLQHEVLMPGYHKVGFYGRLDDFDITFSTKKEEFHTTSAEGLGLDLKVAVVYRPIVSELYEIDTEIGPSYYEEVIQPEFRSSAAGVFARHSWKELRSKNDKIEDEIEEEVRRRTAGKHVEISSVVMETVGVAPEIEQAVREREVGVEEASRKKRALEDDDLREKLALSHEAEKAKMRAEAGIRGKQQEHAIAEEQAAIDRIKAETEAAVRVTKAKADAEETKLMAVAHAEENRAERHTLTPLAVMDHAYEALGKLGGSGTMIMLGDWSKVPNFLFPRMPGFDGSMNGIKEAPVPGNASTKTVSPTLAPTQTGIPFPSVPRHPIKAGSKI